jgi:hypothetical protein
VRGVAGAPDTPARDRGLGAGGLPRLVPAPRALMLSAEPAFPEDTPDPATNPLRDNFVAPPTTGDGGAIDPAGAGVPEAGQAFAAGVIPADAARGATGLFLLAEEEEEEDANASLFGKFAFAAAAAAATTAAGSILIAVCLFSDDNFPDVAHDEEVEDDEDEDAPPRLEDDEDEDDDEEES